MIFYFLNLNSNFTVIEVLDVPKSRRGMSEIDSDLVGVIEKLLLVMQCDCSFRELQHDWNCRDNV